MRVIAGKAKGRKLRSVPGPGTRPITDRAKSGLFSILSRDVRDSRFLDLFAGTGQIGIEALSRGAKEAYFVELAHSAIHTIHENLKLTRLGGTNTHVIRVDVFKYLAKRPEPFDYIYVAPPQYRSLALRALQMLDQHPDWLVDDSWVIVQINPTEYEELETLPLSNLEIFDQRQYGGVMLCFYWKILD